MPTKRDKRKQSGGLDFVELFKTASRITNPIGLVGLIIVAVFGVCYLVLSLGIFSKIGANETFVLLDNLVGKFTWIAEIAVIVAAICYFVRYLPNLIIAVRRQPSSDIETPLLRTQAPAEHPSARKDSVSPGASGGQPRVVRVGIRSFSRGTEQWEHDMNSRLCLLESFDGRKIKNPKSWQKEIVPRLQSFLREPCKRDEECHLHLVAHISIAFCAGYCLPTKTGLTVFPVQYTPTPVLWKPGQPSDTSIYPLWSVETQTINQGRVKKKGSVDLAIGLSVSQDLRNDVRDYVTNSLPQVARIMWFLLEPASNQAVSDGTHAKMLVDQVVNKLKTERTSEERSGTLHIFAAAPNGLVFLLGQLAHGFGQCIMYEYAFEQNLPGAYEVSISFPLKL